MLHLFTFNGPFSRLRQFLATENLLQMMKNAFYFTLKSLFVLNIFGLVEKQPDPD